MTSREAVGRICFKWSEPVERIEEEGLTRRVCWVEKVERVEAGLSLDD